MGEIKSHRDLIVWQKSIALVKEIYALTRKFPKSETFALSNQMQRAVVSIPSNIAEGHTRQHTGEFRQFLYTALGSAAELDTQIVISNELGYVNKEETCRIEEQLDEIRKMTYVLISRLRS